MKYQNTKQLRQAYKEYLLSEKTSLFDCYESFSKAKWDALEYCKELCYQLNGDSLRIISHSCFAFSVGFVFVNEEGKSVFAYITKDYNRFMLLD